MVAVYSNCTNLLRRVDSCDLTPPLPKGQPIVAMISPPLIYAHKKELFLTRFPIPSHQPPTIRKNALDATDEAVGYSAPHYAGRDGGRCGPRPRSGSHQCWWHWHDRCVSYPSHHWLSRANKWLTHHPVTHYTHTISRSLFQNSGRNIIPRLLPSAQRWRYVQPGCAGSGYR
jgi:hypothetical protein